MALINRFSRLFTADLHAVLDRIEEPDVLLKQAVREMEDELGKMQAGSRSLLQDLERLDTQGRADRALLSDLDEELDVCFQSDEEELARSLIKRKLEGERRLKIATARREAAINTRETLEASITENQDHLANMREKLELLVDEALSSSPRDRVDVDINVGKDEIEIAFLKEKQRRTHA